MRAPIGEVCSYVRTTTRQESACSRRRRRGVGGATAGGLPPSERGDRRIADSFDADEALELFCECELGDCSARLSVSHPQYEAVRRFPTRFLVLADHASSEERIVEVLSGSGSVVVEKVGIGARTAILGDSRKRVAAGGSGS